MGRCICAGLQRGMTEMFIWIKTHIGTIMVSLILMIIMGMIFRKIYKEKKQGKSPCGCQCGCCPMHGCCHENCEK